MKKKSRRRGGKSHKNLLLRDLKKYISSFVPSFRAMWMFCDIFSLKMKRDSRRLRLLWLYPNRILLAERRARHEEETKSVAIHDKFLGVNLLQQQKLKLPTMSFAMAKRKINEDVKLLKRRNASKHTRMNLSESIKMSVLCPPPPSPPSTTMRMADKNSACDG